jgi:probable HAF family extracellular repeat protein
MRATTKKAILSVKVIALLCFFPGRAVSVEPILAGFYSLRSVDGEASVDIADDGTVAVAGVNSVSFRWSVSAGVLDTPFAGFATSISGDSQTVVGTNSNLAFRWNAGSGYMYLPRYAGGGGSAIARGVSADGSVVVGEDAPSPGTKRAVKWTAATGTVDLGSLGGPSGESSAFAVSRDGTRTIGDTWTTTPGILVGFIHTSATGMQSIGSMPGNNITEPHAISADNTTLVGFGNTGLNFHAFRWRAGSGFQALGDLGPVPGQSYTGNQALAVNADGSVIVGTQGDREAMIWDQTHGMRALQSVLVGDYGFDLTGWTLELAQSISDDGRVIAGSGVFQGPTGLEERGWVAVLPVPELPSGTLCIAGLASLAAVYIRRQFACFFARLRPSPDQALLDVSLQHAESLLVPLDR